MTTSGSPRLAFGTTAKLGPAPTVCNSPGRLLKNDAVNGDQVQLRIQLPTPEACRLTRATTTSGSSSASSATRTLRRPRALQVHLYVPLPRRPAAHALPQQPRAPPIIRAPQPGPHILHDPIHDAGCSHPLAEDPLKNGQQLAVYDGVLAGAGAGDGWGVCRALPRGQADLDGAGHSDWGREGLRGHRGGRGEREESF